MKTPRKGKKKNTPQQEWNGWKFAAYVAQRVFNLFDSGKIYPALFVLFMLFVAFISYLMPEAALGRVVESFFESVLGSTGVWILLLVGTNSVWLYLYRRQSDQYIGEIDRLTKFRSELLHLEDRNKIAQHRSTSEPGNETYLNGG